MWAMNLGKPGVVPQLNEAMAIELGANLLGEVIIFSIGAGLLIFEYVRQVNKETKKEELLKQEKAELTQTLCDLQLQVERQDAQMREMNRVLADLGSCAFSRIHLLAVHIHSLHMSALLRNIPFADSRSWLSKKLNFLQNETQSTEAPKPCAAPVTAPISVPLITSSQVVAATTAANGTTTTPTTTASRIAGNYDNGYDPTRGLLSKALHLIETELFYSEPVYRPFEQYGRVQSCLAYLGYAPPASKMQVIRSRLNSTADQCS